MQLFYCNNITDGGICTLDAEESRHAVRVLRMHEGDTLHVTDGLGNLFLGRIVVADPRDCSIEVTAPAKTDLMAQQAACKIHIAVAPTKNPARMEWLVEKAVELGVGEISLLQCDHSERSFLKTDRLERIALSAMKQSLRTLLPAIHPAVTLDEWLAAQQQGIPSGSLKPLHFIAHCEADKPRTPLSTALVANTDTTVLIGPEGDFSPREIDMAFAAGFKPVSFGENRLRTETAALYAVAAFNFVNNL